MSVYGLPGSLPLSRLRNKSRRKAPLSDSVNFSTPGWQVSMGFLLTFGNNNQIIYCDCRRAGKEPGVSLVLTWAKVGENLTHTAVLNACMTEKAEELVLLDCAGGTETAWLAGQ